MKTYKDVVDYLNKNYERLNSDKGEMKLITHSESYKEEIRYIVNHHLIQLIITKKDYYSMESFGIEDVIRVSESYNLIESMIKYTRKRLDEYLKMNKVVMDND